ncbi:MAG TPA: hypothetical protein ENI94_04330 [Gammaproteobacteria bacterium]|nr:hypothetical protein [Gammaproteobacteria bacterium]
MGPIEAAAIAVVMMGMYTFYKAQTVNMALNARNTMLPVIKEILDDETAPEGLKIHAIGAFHYSADSSCLPKVVWAVIKNRGIQQTDESPLSTEHVRLQSSLMSNHFRRINVLAAPHWYALFSLLFFAMALLITAVSFGKKSGYRVLSAFEKAWTDPTDRNSWC